MSQQLDVGVSSIELLSTWQLLRGLFTRTNSVFINVKKW